MTKPKKKQQKNDLSVTLLGTLLLVMVVMIVALTLPKEPQRGEFIPPAFEANAVSGTPEVPDGLGYSAPFQEGMAYRFAVCGNVTIEAGQALVYFTNPAENDTWIKLRIYDEYGAALGETGLLKPGEYVQYLSLTKDLKTGTPVRLKIMGYEPETYLSMGSVSLNTVIGGATK